MPPAGRARLLPLLPLVLLLLLVLPPLLLLLLWPASLRQKLLSAEARPAQLLLPKTWAAEARPAELLAAWQLAAQLPLAGGLLAMWPQPALLQDGLWLLARPQPAIRLAAGLPAWPVAATPVAAHHPTRRPMLRLQLSAAAALGGKALSWPGPQAL